MHNKAFQICKTSSYTESIYTFDCANDLAYIDREYADVMFTPQTSAIKDIK
jgi:hypothetical protein